MGGLWGWESGFGVCAAANWQVVVAPLWFAALLPLAAALTRHLSLFLLSAE